MRRWAVVSGLAVLAGAWLGPLPDMASDAFVAHMTMHVALVAVAAPLLALGLAGSRLDPAKAAPAVFAPIPASVLELVVVWGWHAPALHHAARHGTGPLIVEQAMFLGVGLLVWLSAFGGSEEHARERRAAGIIGLLLTSMHMTLLGGLLTLSPRVLYSHAGTPPFGLSALTDLHLGGTLMLLGGGLSYLIGGLYLLAGLLRQPARTRAAEEHG